MDFFDEEHEAVLRMQAELDTDDRAQLAKLLGVSAVDIDDAALEDLRFGPTDQAVCERWAAKAWVK